MIHDYISLLQLVELKKYCIFRRIFFIIIIINIFFRKRKSKKNKKKMIIIILKMLNACLNIPNQ
jgi:hypothetical protein